MSRTANLPVALFVNNPTLTSVTPTGGAAGAYTYKIVAIASDGTTTAASAGVSDAMGPTTLDNTHFETLVWTDPVAAPAFIDVYRTAGGATQGKIARVAAGVQTLVDNGLAGDATTPPSSNTTGVGKPVPVSELSGLSAQVSGTFTATLQIQAKIDPSVSWVNVGAPVVGDGVVDVTATLKSASEMRVMVTAYTSGSPVVVVAGHFEGGGLQETLAGGSATQVLHGGNAGYSSVATADIAAGAVTAAKLAAGVTAVTNGGAGNAGNILLADANGKAAGHQLENEWVYLGSLKVDVSAASSGVLTFAAYDMLKFVVAIRDYGISDTVSLRFGNGGGIDGGNNYWSRWNSENAGGVVFVDDAVAPSAQIELAGQDSLLNRVVEVMVNNTGLIASKIAKVTTATATRAANTAGYLEFGAGEWIDSGGPSQITQVQMVTANGHFFRARLAAFGMNF